MTLIRDHDDERLARIEHQMELARIAQKHAEQAVANAKARLAAAQAALSRAEGRLLRAPGKKRTRRRPLRVRHR